MLLMLEGGVLGEGRGRGGLLGRRGLIVSAFRGIIQVLQNSLMGSARMREEVARRVAESLSGEMRDEGLSTAREWVPPCPHIPGATVSHKTVNGLRVVLPEDWKVRAWDSNRQNGNSPSS
jgi:hypothetical protein